jgi:5-methylcytosine-specific restriction protein A
VEWNFTPADPSHIRIERAKAREMKKTSWWKQRLGEGKCYHCEGKFPKEQLTMDHLIPLARGGKTTKNNVVVSCHECNANKKYFTRAELALQELQKDPNTDNDESE